MGQEHVRIGRALYCLKRLRAPVYELKTDSILYRPAKRAKKSLADIAYETCHLTRDHFEGSGNRRLDEACPLPPSLGRGNIFRVNAATDDDFLQCNPKKPMRGNVFALEPPMWRNLSREEAEHRILRGESVLVEGCPGTGNIHTCQGFVELSALPE